MSEMPCPACRERGAPGTGRIGSQRTACPVCNSFAQQVLRTASQRLRQRHTSEYELLRAEVAAETYPRAVARWEGKKP